MCPTTASSGRRASMKARTAGLPTGRPFTRRSRRVSKGGVWQIMRRRRAARRASIPRLSLNQRARGRCPCRSSALGSLLGAAPARPRGRRCSSGSRLSEGMGQGRRRAATTPRTTMVGYAARGRGHRIRGDRTHATAARRACRACPLPDADRGLGGGGAGGAGGRAGARAAGAYRPAAEVRAAARLRERPGVEAARAGEGVVTMEGWTVVAALVVGGALLVLAREVRRARVPRDDAGALLLLQQQLDALRAQLSEALAGQGRLVGQQLALLTGQMNDRLREGLELVQRSQSAVGERLDNTSRVVGEVQKGLGELREATAKVYEVGRDVASLHDILRAPKLRGGLGEFLLGDLLAQVLPHAHFTLQHDFRSGRRVHAVVV